MPALAATVPAPPLRPVSPSDDELLARARQGDDGAFRTLMERHEQTVAVTVVAMMGRTSEVDDVMQDVFIQFYRSLDRFRGDASVRTYLKRIAVNRALDALRRRKRFLGRFLSRDDETISLVETASGTPPLEQDERDRLVHQAIATLPPKYRAVVTLRLIDGFSTEETAQMLGIPYGTVLSRLSRANQKLKHFLQPYFDETLPASSSPATDDETS